VGNFDDQLWGISVIAVITDVDAQTQSGSSSATISCSINEGATNTSTGAYAVVNCASG